MNIDNKNDINNKVNQICQCLDFLNNNTLKINQKISEITEVYYKFNFNNTLQINESFEYMKFQIELLKVENKYYSDLLAKIKFKFIKDIYEISESILMLLCSIENINLDNNKEKDNILERVVALKKHKNNLETSEILEIINSTLCNLDLTKEFVNIFEKYIIDTIKKNKRENLHCNNFKINLQNKKEHILLEYNKFYNKINELVTYFVLLTAELTKQLKYQKLLDFLVNKNDE